MGYSSDLQQLEPLFSKSDFPPHSVWERRFSTVYENAHGYIACRKFNEGLILGGDPVLKSGACYSSFFKELKEDHPKSAITGYYFSKKVAQESCWRTFKAGTSEILDMETFSLKGHRARDLRRAKNHCPKLNVKFSLLEGKRLKNYKKRINQLYGIWLGSKPGPVIRFLLGPPVVKENDKVFVAVDENDELKGYLICCPYSSQKCYYLDQFVRHPTTNKFVMDNLILHAIEHFEAEGVRQLSFGFSAFNAVTIKGPISTALWLKSKTDWFYPNRSLLHYKSKFTTHRECRYILMSPEGATWKQISLLLKGTFKNEPRPLQL
ncbi:MAG: hypothetical protein CL677_09190 [Bdellovibrionaceae bacterium]|nr:hypothetical protein [Pseudobdellovibrionaceae bacterium]|tara:strand:+ start:41648 stop:42610 length:963 start_codon:yes stop_codon:yes gene_type:complete